MSRIKWDQTGDKIYELGCDHGVLYRHDLTTPKDPKLYAKAIPWNGLTSVDESPEGGDANDHWADNIKYASIVSVEVFGGTINAYTYPDEFMECDGSLALADGVFITGQPRQAFGFSYRTKIGNDTEGLNYGYKLHLVYGAMATPSDKTRETINDSPDPTEFSWDFTTTPVDVATPKPGGGSYEPTSHLIFDSTKMDPEKLKALEDILYGTDSGDEAEGATEGRLPMPDEIIKLLQEAA